MDYDLSELVLMQVICNLSGDFGGFRGSGVPVRGVDGLESGECVFYAINDYPSGSVCSITVIHPFDDLIFPQFGPFIYRFFGGWTRAISSVEPLPVVRPLAVVGMSHGFLIPPFPQFPV